MKIEGKTTTVQASHYLYNPRKISTRQKIELAESLEQLGDLSGVVHNLQTGQLVGGNQRSDIFDLDQCDIILIHTNDEPDHQGTIAIGFIKWKDGLYNYRQVQWNEATEAKANIVANKLGGEWDHKILREHFETADLLQWGFNKKDIQWVNDVDSFRDSDEDNMPPPAQSLHSTAGDIYQLNDHRVICGNSTKPETYIKLMNGVTADQICTDPPYNVEYKGKWASDRSVIANDNLKENDFSDFLYDFYSESNKHLKPGGSIYVFHADSTGHIFRNEFVNANFYLAQCLIWVKNYTVISRQDYHWQHEPILYGFKKDEETYQKLIAEFQKLIGKDLQYFEEAHMPILYGWKTGAAHVWNTDRKQSTVIHFDKPNASPIHLTMKPVGLVEYLITNNTLENETVLDPFLGSGTTVIAADKQNRVCYGIELDPVKLDDSIRRWVAYRKKHDLPFKVKKNNRIITKENWLHE